MQHTVFHLRRFIERRQQFIASCITFRLEDSLLSDRRQITIFQRDLVKSSFPVLQSICEVQSIRSRHGFADQFTEVSLSCDKRDDGNGTIGILIFYELDQLLAFAMNERQVCRSTGQPQNEFVQKQNYAIILQALRMLTDDSQSLIQRQKLFIATTGLRGVGTKISGDQHADQL